MRGTYCCNIYQNNVRSYVKSLETRLGSVYVLTGLTESDSSYISYWFNEYHHKITPSIIVYDSKKHTLQNRIVFFAYRTSIHGTGDAL